MFGFSFKFTRRKRSFQRNIKASFRFDSCVFTHNIQSIVNNHLKLEIFEKIFRFSQTLEAHLPYLRQLQGRFAETQRIIKIGKTQNNNDNNNNCYTIFFTKHTTLEKPLRFPRKFNLIFVMVNHFRISLTLIDLIQWDIFKCANQKTKTYIYFEFLKYGY